MSPAARERLLDGLRRRNPEVLSAIARRSVTVTALKKLLPIAAACLLAALAVIPSLKTGPDADRVTYHAPVSADAGAASRMQGAQYHGMDQHGEPFTLTAVSAEDQGADVVRLTAPEGDITLKSGAWLMLKSDSGLFHQKEQHLALNGDVTLYRNDGTTLTVAAADIDLRGGNASSSAPVQVQGPFGTLSAQNGFLLTDRGADIKFLGPAATTLIAAQ